MKLLKIFLILCFAFLILIFTPINMLTTIIDDSNLVEIREAGTYPVELYYLDENGDQVVTIINVTIKYRRTIENKEVSEAIDAHDIEIEKGQFSNLTDEQLIQLTRARAWNTITLVNLPISVTKKETTDINGHYKVTFSTANDTQTSANIIEVERIFLTEMSKYYSFSQSGSSFYRLLILATNILLFSFIMLYLSYHKVKQEVREIDVILYNNETSK